MRTKRKTEEFFDADLEDLPPQLRWRAWMGRVEAVIFASPKPVTREALALVVGRSCNLDALIEDIRCELADRPYELVAVAGGWQHRTRLSFGDAIRRASGVQSQTIGLSKLESQILTAIAYFQPITRRELGATLGRDVSRDMLADLRSFGLIGSGPKSPRAGAPNTYITTASFLTQFGFNSLNDLPCRQELEEKGLLSKEALLSGELRDLFGIDGDQAQSETVDVHEEAEAQ
jgi:segregation and condensation protein B